MMRVTGMVARTLPTGRPRGAGGRAGRRDQRRASHFTQSVIRGVVGRQERLQPQFGDGDVERRPELHQRREQPQLAVAVAQPQQDGKADVVRAGCRGRAGADAAPSNADGAVPAALDPRTAAPDARVAALVEDFLDSLISPRTRASYATDLALFFAWLRGSGVHPLEAQRPHIDR